MHPHIPASVHLFLSADKLVPLDTVFSAGTEIPCSGKKVKTNDLAVWLLAFAIWDLKKEGFVELKQIKKKSFFVFQSSVLTVKKLKDLPLTDTLESLIMEGLNGNESGLKNLVHSMFKEDTPWPHKTIINIVINTAICLGLGSADEIKGSVKQFFKSFGGNVNFIPACEIIHPLVPDFEHIIDQWNQFGKDSPELSSSLMSTCRAGINSRILNQDDNGSD